MNKLEFQKEIVDRLNISYENGRVFHSYIFWGEKNCGKVEVANYLASLVLDGDKTEITYISTDKQNISKEQILEINYDLRTTSLSGKYKFYIILEADKLSIAAQNSLLRIIEDYANNSCVIFIVNNLSKILPTLVSRSQIVKFKPLPFHLSYDELKNEYEDKIKLKYALYLDSVNYDEVYYSEIIDEYIDKCEKIIRLYFSKKLNITYKFQEVCYNSFSSKELILQLLNVITVNISSMIEYANNTNEIFDERYLDLANIDNEKMMYQFLESIFKCNEMLENNVNYKLAFDLLGLEREVH